MTLQHRISHQRIRHIIESYLLTGDEPTPFEIYLSELLDQYPSGVIELALVETLAKSWLHIPMVKGVPFLSAAHEQLKQWQQAEPGNPPALHLTPSQFTQITGLDPQAAFSELVSFGAISAQATSTQATAEST